MAEAPYDFSDFADYFAVLDCQVDEDLDSMKKKWRALVLDWHPDKRPDSPTKTGQKMFTLINEAWETLKDETKRAEYTAQWREYQKTKLLPSERAELARKEGNDLYKKGQAHARENNIPQALNAYQAAIDKYAEGIRQNTDDHRLYSNRALCYAVLRDWARAKNDALQVLRIRDNFMKGWFTLVRCFIMENKLDDALAYLNQGLEKCGRHEDLVKLGEEIGQLKQEQQTSGGRKSTPREKNASGKESASGPRSADSNTTPRERPASYRERSASNVPAAAATPGAESNASSYGGGRDVTPSRTPPTPVQQARSFRGMAQAAFQSFSASFGGSPGTPPRAPAHGTIVQGGETAEKSPRSPPETHHFSMSRPPRGEAVTPPQGNAGTPRREQPRSSQKQSLSRSPSADLRNNTDPLDQSTSQFGGTANFGSSIGYLKNPASARQPTPPRMPPNASQSQSFAGKVSSMGQSGGMTGSRRGSLSQPGGVGEVSPGTTDWQAWGAADPRSGVPGQPTGKLVTDNVPVNPYSFHRGSVRRGSRDNTPTPRGGVQSLGEAQASTQQRGQNLGESVGRNTRTLRPEDGGSRGGTPRTTPRGPGVVEAPSRPREGVL